MANHASAKKRHRQSLKRRVRNRHWRARVRNAVRLAQAGAEAGDEDAAVHFQAAQKLLRKAQGKGIMKRRFVSRTVSHLQRRLNRAQAGSS